MRFNMGSWLAVLGALALTACASDADRRAAGVRDTACADFNFPVYFQPNADTLTPAAGQAIADAVGRTKACRVAGLSISGLTSGGDAALVARRADAISRALVADGLAAPAPVIDATERTGGLRLLGRRTQVRVHLEGPGA